MTRISSARLYSKGACGFTLVELLVVLTIVAILTAISIAGFRSVNGALNLSSATQAVMSELTTARQTALTLDQTVQVRFYQYSDTTSGSTTQEFQAMQSFISKGGSYSPLDKVIYFPATIMISPYTGYSAPFGSQIATASTPLASDPSIQKSGIGQSYTYVAVSFKSNGTIDPQPATSPWFITLYEKKYGGTATTAPSPAPANFTTISVDPQDGRTRMFQP